MDSGNSINLEFEPYIVTEPHVCEYDIHLTVTRGEQVQIGETYAGPEGWVGWVLCKNKAGIEGWVPEQYLYVDKQTNIGHVKTNYTSRELEVLKNQSVFCSIEVNGWRWCQTEDQTDSGWVPSSNLRRVYE